MTIWSLFLLLIAAGAIVWLLEQAPFISDSVKPIFRWVVVVIVVLVLLNALGALTWLKTTTIGG